MDDIKERLARFYNRCVSEDEDDWEDYLDWIVETKDPVQAFGCWNWNESTPPIVSVKRGKAVKGMIYYDKVQVRKGMTRTNLAVAEAGDVRLVIMGEGDWE